MAPQFIFFQQDKDPNTSSSEDDLFNKVLKDIEKQIKTSSIRRGREPISNEKSKVKKNSSVEDDLFNKVLQDIQKQIKTRSIKRGGEPITNEKSKVKKNSSVEVPEVKSKRRFVVGDIIGYVKNSKQQDGDFYSLRNGCKIGTQLKSVLKDDACISTKFKYTYVPGNLVRYYAKKIKQDDDFLSLSSLTNPDPTLKDALETLNDGEIGTQLESVLKDDADISTKLNVTFVPGSYYAENFKQDDDFWSLSSLELDSNLKPIDGKIKINDKIGVTSKPVAEDGVKTPLDCNDKMDEKIHSVQDVVDFNASTVDEFTEASCTKFMVVSQDESVLQGEKLKLLTKGKLEMGGKEILEWIETGIQEDQQDEIFKQAERQLKEISKSIQIKLDAMKGPIAFKNYKFYNFLLDLEEKLNTNFRENSDIDEQDFDDCK